MLTWTEAGKIVEEMLAQILGRPVPCEPEFLDDSYWCVRLAGTRLPIGDLHKIVQALHLSKSESYGIVPDEGELDVADIHMDLCERLVREKLGISYTHCLLADDGLWLVDVTEPAAKGPEIVTIGGTDVCFAELKSKDELFNFFQEGTCDHAALMEFCEDYKARYENDLCWPYPIATDNHLGRYLVLVKEGVLSLPYDGFDGENYEFFSLKGAEVLTTDGLIELADEFRMFTNDLLAALNDMIIYTQAKERSSS